MGEGGRRLAGVAVVAAVLMRGAGAQEVTRTEAGVGAYAQTSTYNSFTSYAPKHLVYSPMVRYTLNLNASLALETSAASSLNEAYFGDRQGGHETLVLGGLKAGMRRRRLGVFGRLDMGATSYSRADAILSRPPRYSRETHFTIEQGVALEAYVSRRTILRADVEESLSANFRSPVVKLGPDVVEYVGGSVPHHLGMALTVERRFGELREAPTLEPRSERLSVGAFFPLQIREHLLAENTPVLGGGGAWVEIPNYRFLSTDVVAFDLPQNDHTAGVQDGGTSFSAFAGPKVGFHLGGLGVFAKARPGVTRFSVTNSSLTLTSCLNDSVDHPQTEFTLDMGGVVEYAPVRHVLLRFEGGDALIFYHAHTVRYTSNRGYEDLTYPPIRESSMLFLTGVGWRF